MVQKNGTPFKKPINNGGSPMGVSNPPKFEIKKMKKREREKLELTNQIRK
jgi:hypothetical protein